MRRQAEKSLKQKHKETALESGLRFTVAGWLWNRDPCNSQFTLVIPAIIFSGPLAGPEFSFSRPWALRRLAGGDIIQESLGRNHPATDGAYP